MSLAILDGDKEEESVVDYLTYVGEQINSNNPPYHIWSNSWAALHEQIKPIIQYQEQGIKLTFLLFITGLSTDQVFLDDRKADHKKDGTCKGVYRKVKTRISCSKKANFVCRLTKAEWQENKRSRGVGSFGESAASGQSNDQFAAPFNP